MKAAIRMLVCCLLLMGLCACRESETVDFSLFLDRWNRLAVQPLQAEDFFAEADAADGRSFVSLGDGLLLRLLPDAQRQLREVRLLLAKAQPDGSARPLTKTEPTAFAALAATALGAYGGLTAADAAAALAPFALDRAATYATEGEQVLDCGDIHCVLLSTPLECVLVLRNRRLNDIPSTQKPPQKAPFDQTTATRKETVPHK